MKRKPNRRAALSSGDSRKAGFILVVTVTLLGFLVLLLVFLSLVARVETAVSINNLKATQAKQNALFALRAAIGQLQREAGPDQRVTATADLLDSTAENTRWTGVWDTTDPGAGPVWLVSQADPSTDPDPDGTLTNPVQLVGNRTGAVWLYPENSVDVELAPIEVDAYPGLEGSQVIGRYAYWVGDEGVKASLVMPDQLASVDYGPYAILENRLRLRQQVPFSHQFFEDLVDSGEVGYDPSADDDLGFDPAAGSNPVNLPKIITRQQMRVLTSTKNSVSFTSFLSRRYHGLTQIAFGVLSNTHPNAAFAGLKKDLSAQPGLLGSGFAAWADYSNYMEAPAIGNTAVPPITTESDLRRRYDIVAPPASPSSGDPVMSVNPVITSFVVQFGVRREGDDELVVASRAHVSLWNPYTSALVPETLQVEITALPQITVTDALLDAVNIPLQGLTGDPFLLDLPFSAGGFISNYRPLLPGRVHNWRTDNDSEPSFTLRFNYTQVNSAVGWLFDTGLYLAQPGNLRIDAPAAQIVVRLKRGADTLQTIVCPSMPESGPWNANTAGNDSETWDFGYGFRLKQPSNPANAITDGLNWLATLGEDPRAGVIGPDLLVPHNPVAGWSPTGYSDTSPLQTDWNGIGGVAGFLLNRRVVTDTPGYTFNHDTPVFELPRGPILSLGSLQHMRVQDVEPFAIGNSWGAEIDAPTAGRIGSWWDRFFFSGETIDDDRMDSARIEPLPYYHLRPVDTRTDRSTPFDLGVLRSAGAASARYLLMGGAFNINSTSEAAWTAVLKSIRPSVTNSWERVILSSQTGGMVTSGSQTITEQITDSLQAGSTAEFPDEADRASGFFRYAHSAQETFGSGSETYTLADWSGFDRSQYRQGIRAGDTGSGAQSARNLTSDNFKQLAIDIVAQVRAHGPFLSMDEFISDDGTGAGSALEQAIGSGVPGGIDPAADPLDLSAYILTQADVLTAIGPMLTTRSDTFVVRAYGEVVNPIRDRDADGVGDIEARAWCEAIVQRLPVYVDPTIDDPEDTPTVGSVNETFGRRFEVIHFRWLTAEDI